MRHLLLLLPFLFLFLGCDEVAPHERWSQPVPIVPKKKVLIMEYTGQKCVNCPDAAALIATLQQGATGNNVIAVAVHGGRLSEHGEQHVMGLANADSEWLTQQAHVQGWPAASIDGAALSFPPTWSGSVAQQLAKDQEAELTLSTHYEPSSRQLSAEVVATTSQADSYLSVFLVEDSIRSLQYLQNGQRTAEYLHRHVLRQILTPREGIALQATPSSQPSHHALVTADKRAAPLRSARWVQTLVLPAAYGLLSQQPDQLAQHPQLGVHPERMHLVAFVVHRPTGRVLQVEQRACTGASH